MKLQILVPQYKETDEEVKPLLDSIAIQQTVDFNEIGVIICNDGSDVFLTDEFLKSYPFEIIYSKQPHRGVSGTRNACLDLATAEYVMFCDADDMFCNACGMHVIFLNIREGFDTLNAEFYEETRTSDTREPVYVKHENDATFVHGKVHRRQFLIDKQIRWDERLTIHEDSYFNVLCLNLASNMRYCKTPYYLWRWRDGSVCRKDPTYNYATYNNLIDSNDALVSEFIKRGYMDKAMYFLCYMIFETYYTMNKPSWVSQENQAFKEQAERYFGKYFHKWEHLWEQVPLPDKVNCSGQARTKVLAEGMLLEPITVFDWLNQCKEKYYGEQKSERKNPQGADGGYRKVQEEESEAKEEG